MTTKKLPTGTVRHCMTTIQEAQVQLHLLIYRKSHTLRLDVDIEEPGIELAPMPNSHDIDIEVQYQF